MATVKDIAIGIMQIAVVNKGLCTFEMAYEQIPDYVNLSLENLLPSTTRPGEPRWHQLVRNIICNQYASSPLGLGWMRLFYTPGSDKAIGFELLKPGALELARRGLITLKPEPSHGQQSLSR